jgi:tetratricopeptide (TPR) repeat protein
VPHVNYRVEKEVAGVAARISKRQLKEDTFVETTLRAWEYVREREKSFFIALIGVLCVAIAIVWTGHARQQARVRASSQFADALASFRTGDFQTATDLFGSLSKEYGGEEGAYADYFLGSSALEAGKYLDAIASFDRYLAKSGKFPFFHDAAMEGKAVALENEHRYEEAGSTYLDLARNLKTNSFMETSYLKRAAEDFRLANKTEKALEVLGTLLQKSTGTERRDVEVEMEILRG